MRRKLRFTIFVIMVGLCAFCWENLWADTFIYQALPQAMKERFLKNHDWYSSCPVPLDRLRLLTVTYYDFQGKKQIGNLVMFDAITPYTLTAFKKMYAMHYPLETVGLKVNPNSYAQTTAYNCRPIIGELNRYSMHAYGLAIDINVAHNPYLGDFKVDGNGKVSGQLVPPLASSFPYLNRADQRPGMNEKIVNLMAESGFIRWGGQWQDRVDYQHFEVPENIAKTLVYLDEKSGKQLLQLVINCPTCAKKLSTDSKWKYLYELYPKQFMPVLAEYFPKFNTLSEGRVYTMVYQKLSSSS